MPQQPQVKITKEDFDIIFNRITSEYIKTGKAVNISKFRKNFGTSKLKFILKGLVENGRLKQGELINTFYPINVEMPVFFKGKKVGHIKGKKYYTYRGKLHVMKKWGSFGVSLELLEKLKRLGIEEIIFIFMDENKKRLLSTSLDNMLNSELTFTNKSNSEEDVQKHIRLSTLTELSSIESMSKFDLY